MVYGFLAGVVLVVSAVFLFQNIEPVNVKFMVWNFQTTLALALFLAFVLGFAGAYLSVLARFVSKKLTRPKEAPKV